MVIGSGIAGLACAIRLKAKGYEVTVMEANSYPGGKLTEFTSNGYRFDAGPSLFTMPTYVDELFEISNEDPREHFNYKKLEHSCNYFYEDGTRFTAPSDPIEFAGVMHDRLGEDKRSIIKFIKRSGKMFRVTAPVFLEKSLHKWSTYFSFSGIWGILNLWRLRMFSTMDSVNRSAFSSYKTVQFFNRFATYNGSNPYKAPATLNVIPHLEFGYGTFLPENGMHDITSSLYQLALRKGIQFEFNSKVTEIAIEKNKVTGVKVEDKVIEADLVVSNMDVYHTYKRLMKGFELPQRIEEAEPSSSALIFYWGIKGSFPELDLHNVFFTREYAKEFESIFNYGSIYPDPTIYINITSKYVSKDAPKGCENWFVMINVPANQGQDWDTMVTRARINILEKLRRILGKDLKPFIETEEVLDPVKIEARTSSRKGSLYGSSSNSRFSAFFRHPNFKSDVKGLYFCGGSVHPGGGIPLCLLGAKIVANMVKPSTTGH